LRFFRHTVESTANIFTSVDWQTTGKIFIRVVTEDVIIGIDQTQMNNGSYFTLVAGQTVVLDQPTSLGSTLLYLQAVANTATVEVWLTEAL